MSFDMDRVLTNAVYKGAFEVAEDAFGLIEKLIEMLANENGVLQKKFAKYLEQGGNPIMFYANDDHIAGILKNKLESEGISYGFIKGENGELGFLIRSEDKDIVDELKYQSLIEAGRYVQEVDLYDLAETLESSNAIDKEMVIIEELTEEEARAIVNKCNRVTEGYTVGIEKGDDGICRIGVDAKFAVPNGETVQSDLARSTAEAMMSLYGANAVTKAAQLKFDMEMYEKIAELSATNDTNFIVSASSKERERYIELNEEGFTVYEKQKKSSLDEQDNPVEKDVFVAIKTGVKNTPGYAYELRLELDKINDISIIADKDTLAKYLYDSGFKIASDRPIKTTSERRIAADEKAIVSRIDKMVKEKLVTDGYLRKKHHDIAQKGGNSTKRIDTYELEVGVAKNRYMKEYKANFASILDSLDSARKPFGVDPQAYADLIDDITIWKDKHGLDMSIYHNVANKISDRISEVYKSKHVMQQKVKEKELSPEINNKTNDRNRGNN